MRTRTAQSKTHRAKLPNRKALSAWMITLAATAASTYALDTLATAAGVLLVASELLSGLDHQLALALLAATYVLWGIALRANLGANWLLLRRIGTSTNVLSKAAFDLTTRRGARAQRAAAGAGYVATELAKEAPYYASAFGAATLTDTVSSNDALLFLAGTNLGAAAYEYGLARLTRRFLRHRRNASVGTDRVPQRDRHRRVISRPTAPVPPVGGIQRVEVHRRRHRGRATRRGPPAATRADPAASETTTHDHTRGSSGASRQSLNRLGQTGGSCDTHDDLRASAGARS
jgi:hypothetical protein